MAIEIVPFYIKVDDKWSLEWSLKNNWWTIIHMSKERADEYIASPKELEENMWNLIRKMKEVSSRKVNSIISDEYDDDWHDDIWSSSISI